MQAAEKWRARGEGRNAFSEKKKYKTRNGSETLTACVRFSRSRPCLAQYVREISHDVNDGCRLQIIKKKKTCNGRAFQRHLGLTWFLQRRADSLTTVVVTQDTFKEATKGSGLLSCWENDNKKKKDRKTQRAGTEPPPSYPEERKTTKEGLCLGISEETKEYKRALHVKKIIIK